MVAIMKTLPFLIYATLVASKLLWEIATDSELKQIYYPYELCVLDLAKKGLYDNSKNIHQQGQCQHLIDPKFNSIDKRCWLGSRQQRIDIGICVTSLSYVKCTPLINRTSFWKTWKSLKPSPQGVLGHAEKLLNVASKRGFRGIIFAGDSMAVQYGQRIACSLVRHNASLQLFGNYFNMASGSGVSALVDLQSTKTIQARNPAVKEEMVLSLYRLPFLIGQYNIIHKGKSQMHGMDSACGIDLANQECRRKHAYDQIYNRITKDLSKYVSPKWASTLIIFVLPIVVKDAWEMKPLASALLKVADELKSVQNKLLVLSPLSQHFKEHPTGQYVNISNRNTRAVQLKQIEALSSPSDLEAIPCKPHTQHLSQHPDSIIFLETITQLDPFWRHKITWFDVTQHSLPWHDLHPESGSSGWAVDCTHYGYNPIMYDGIWEELSELIPNL